MPSPTETGNKKHIVAERVLEPGVSDNLCKLYITNFEDYQVLSLYSELSKRLVAYKVILQEAGQRDIWLNTVFAETTIVDMNANYDLVPRGFSSSGTTDGKPVIQPEPAKGHKHYIQGLFMYNALNQGKCMVYLFQNGTYLDVVVFSGRECLFANAFVCSSETEMLYFMLNALQLSGFKQEDAIVQFDHELAKNTAFTELLNKYFRTSGQMKTPFESPDPEIPGLQELLFLNHIVSLCE